MDLVERFIVIFLRCADFFSPYLLPALQGLYQLFVGTVRHFALCVKLPELLFGNTLVHAFSHIGEPAKIGLTLTKSHIQCWL